MSSASEGEALDAIRAIGKKLRDSNTRVVNFAISVSVSVKETETERQSERYRE